MAITFDTVQRCVSRMFRESLNRYITKVATKAKKSSCESFIFYVIVEFDPGDPGDHDFEQTCHISETARMQGSTKIKI